MTEMVVSVMLMAIAAAIYLGAMASVYTGVNRQQRRSEINDEARAAIEQIDREVRSGNILYDPTESLPPAQCGGKTCVPNFSFRVFTQANATTRIPPRQCVQYLIEGTNLWRRAWEPNAGSSLADWDHVASGIVNRDVSPQVPAFVRQPGNRVLDVTFVVNNRLGQADAPRTVRIESSAAIRNLAAVDPCTP